VIVLVLVCIATVTLVVWLLFELGRLMLGIDRYPFAVDRVVHALAGGVRVAGERMRVPAPIRAARWPAPVRAPGDEAVRPGADELGSEEEEEPAPPPLLDTEWVRHDAMVEQMVRERLYGPGTGLNAGPGRPRRNRPTA
jgi:hypothetical protein